MSIIFINDAFDVNDIGLCGDVIHCDGLASERPDEDLTDDGIWDALFCCEVGLLGLHWLRRVLFDVRVRVVIVIVGQRHNKEVLPFIQQMCNVVELCGDVGGFKTDSSGSGYCKR